MFDQTILQLHVSNDFKIYINPKDIITLGIDLKDAKLPTAKHIILTLIERIIHFLSKIDIEANPEILSKCHEIPEYSDIVALIDQMKLTDIGLSKDDVSSYFKQDTIVSSNLIETHLISIGFFCLPAGM